ncbi:MAG: oligoribonuclease [Proteobacteria bacterium]|nr:oligoribonuclease [Pseudomonadota bacterium]
MTESSAKEDKISSPRDANKKSDVPTRLVWMDLEMTGLDPDRDVIIEMATIITDANLSIIAEGPEIVIQRPAELFSTMDSWNREHHKKSGLWKRVVESTVTERAAEEMTLKFIKEHVQAKDSPLCGNSIWQDRRFIAKYLKKLDDYLHYRLIDVSTLKTLGKMWYPKAMAMITEKRSNHRAMDDIRESIEELKRYRELLMKTAGD